LSRGSKERFLDNFEFGIFDLDGTLVDSMPIYARIFVYIMAKVGVDGQRSESFFRKTGGVPLAIQIRTLLEQEGLADKGIDQKELWDEFVRIVRAEPLKPMPGAEEAVAGIRQRSIKLFLSSGSDDPEEVLQALGLRHHFREVLGSRQVTKGPKHIHMFAQAMDMTVPEFCRQAFLVGDGIVDMKLGREMLIYSFGLVGTLDADELRQAGADETVYSLSELLEI